MGTFMCPYTRNLENILESFGKESIMCLQYYPLGGRVVGSTSISLLGKSSGYVLERLGNSHARVDRVKCPLSKVTRLSKKAYLGQNGPSHFQGLKMGVQKERCTMFTTCFVTNNFGSAINLTFNI